MTFDDDNKPTLEYFKQACKELIDCCSTDKTIEQIEIGQKALAVIYLNLSKEDSKMALMSGLWDYANKKAEERILELTFKS
jgi:hypothetical protein